ncbi:heavy metal-associated isoprenylated plant protein 22-like isoform X1 [Nymphaea colorata]|nr:heavy metal-associated isoprenylated plant protein 22-like isoform X1 [Nymphaea colorata]
MPGGEKPDKVNSKNSTHLLQSTHPDTSLSLSRSVHPWQVITVDLKVSINCSACQRQVKKALLNLDGVESVSTDMEKQKATVTGRVDPKIVLKVLKKKTGKRAALWPNPDQPEKSEEGNAAASEVKAKPSVCGRDESAALLTYFSDENPNSCTIS